METIGFGWKLLNDEAFIEVQFILDTLMKLCVSQGIGLSVKKAEFLTGTDEDFLWNYGLLGSPRPEVLLSTVMFSLGQGCAYRQERNITSCVDHHSTPSLVLCMMKMAKCFCIIVKTLKQTRVALQD